ncbi:MAG: thiol:disulfide interchange protein DsbG [Steroidobacteraceae bacterium]
MRDKLKWVVAATAAAVLCASVPRAAATQSAADGALLALQQARWVREGSTHPRQVLYVFMDANCPYCHTLWQALQPYYAAGLQVRAILVGVIAASSPGKAAAILDAANPSAALRLNEQRWGQGPDPRGGIAPVAHPSVRDLRTLTRNAELMQAFGIQGTPGIVFTATTGKIYVVPGMPAAADLPRLIAAASVPRTIAPAPSRH